ncbi:MAG: molybdopterin-binding protein [Candidatus Binatia bacterium]
MSDSTQRKFLQRVPLARARELIVSLARRTEPETVDVESSLGRITAEPIHARFASPHYRASAMDGIAVRSVDTATASPETPLSIPDVGTDTPAAGIVACTAVDTGNPLPEWADAVIRIEDTVRSADVYQIAAPVPAGRDVRRIGEDAETGALLVGVGHRVRPYDIGAMLATGVERVAVRTPPRLAVLATGTEIVEPGGTPGPGQVIEFNSRMLAGCVAEWGGIAFYAGRVADERAALEKSIRSAASTHDVVCVIAGSSAGRKDYTVEVLAACGTVHFHGVDMMPGKPAALAEIGGKPVIGVPGYPVSAYACYRELVAPLLAAMLGTAPPPITTVRGTVKRRIVSKLGVEELLRVCLARTPDGLVVAPLPRGAGSVTTLVRADGILRIAATSEGVDAGAIVDVELLDTGTVPGSTWVVAGRPDALTAEVETLLRTAGSSLRVAYLGRADYDAVLALALGEAHTAVFSVEDASTARELLATHAPEAEIVSEDGAAALVAVGRAASALPSSNVLMRALRAKR